MGNKVTTLYDFTLTANGSQQIQADANFYKILTASGDVSITRDGGSTIKPMRAGRGERNVQFLTLTIRDLSGAPNSGTILVGDSDFIDDTIVLSSAVSVRPDLSSGNFNSSTAYAVNTAQQVFAPGSNGAGCVILDANGSAYFTAINPFVLIAKAGAVPATINDGEVIAQSMTSFGSANLYQQLELKKPVRIAAGLGLYFISAQVEQSAISFKSARWLML